jgi:hypothetical protein
LATLWNNPVYSLQSGGTSRDELGDSLFAAHSFAVPAITGTNKVCASVTNRRRARFILRGFKTEKESGLFRERGKNIFLKSGNKRERWAFRTGFEGPPAVPALLRSH